jgi:hypothetical protein
MAAVPQDILDLYDQTDELAEDVTAVGNNSNNPDCGIARMIKHCLPLKSRLSTCKKSRQSVPLKSWTTLSW